MIALIVLFSIAAWYSIGLVGSTYLFHENLNGIPTSQYQRVCKSEEQLIHDAKWFVFFLAFAGVFVGLYCFVCFLIPKTVVPMAQMFGEGLVKLAKFLS